MITSQSYRHIWFQNIHTKPKKFYTHKNLFSATFSYKDTQ